MAFHRWGHCRRDRDRRALVRVGPAQVRRLVVEKVQDRAASTGHQPDTAFEILTAVVRLSADEASRLIAAKGLARFNWRAMAQIDVLRELLKNEKDVDVASALNKALAVKK